MKKPNFAQTIARTNGPSPLERLRGTPERLPHESFENYRLRRAILNRQVKRINAAAPGRSHRFANVGMTKLDSVRKHGGYGANLMAAFDRTRFPLWKADRERRAETAMLREIRRGRVS